LFVILFLEEIRYIISFFGNIIVFI
jgi:hypothetical protein